MMWITKHCLFCGSNAAVRELYPRTFTEKDLTPEVFSARRETEHFHYKIVQCSLCGLVFSREILPPDILSDLYAKSHVTFGSYAHVLRRDYWAPLEKHVQGLVRHSALEIGCSSGFFLEELHERGFKKIVGLEPSLEAKQAAHASVRECIRSEFFTGARGLPDTRFDLVCLFQTIDHLAEPDVILRSIREVLNPGGRVYLICHDVKAFQARVLGEKSPIVDIEHIYLFNQKTLARLLQEAGLEVEAVGKLKNSYPLEYWLHLVPLPRWLKAVLKTIFQWTGFGQWSPALRVGNIFAVAREPLSSASQ